MTNNTQAVQRSFEEFMKGNTSAVIDLCTDDVTWGNYDNPGVPIAGTFKGKDGVKRFFSMLSEYLDFTSFTPKEFYGEGNNVLVLGHNAGKVKKTGKTFDAEWAMVFRFRGSKISSTFFYGDTRQQAEAFQEGFDVQRKETFPAPGVKAER